MRYGGLSGINHPFGWLSLSSGQVPTCYSPVRRYIARLACVRRTASVHPEPGSNSSKKVCVPIKLELALIFSSIKPEVVRTKLINDL